MMNKAIGFFICFIVAAFVSSTMVYTVDERQIAVVFAFGEFKSTVNAPEGAGGNTSGGGLHFKLPAPLQTVSYIDKRIQTLD
ncbi:MAG: SPFH domain-containing protein, partial [Saezia sp.]